MESHENKSVGDDEIYKKSGWDVVRRSSVKELVDSFNKLHPEVTLRPKNIYRRPPNRNSNIRWSKPLKENCEDDYQGNTSDEDITATYVTRIDVQENEQNTIIDKSENLFVSTTDKKPMHKSVRASLENIREKSIVKKRLQEFSTTENRHSSSSLTSTNNLNYFNQLKTRLARCSSVVMQDDSSSESSDNEDFQEAPDTDEENNYIRYEDALEVNIDALENLEKNEKLVEFYRDSIERLCNVPFVLAVIYCSCQFAKIILNLLI